MCKHIFKSPPRFLKHHRLFQLNQLQHNHLCFLCMNFSYPPRCSIYSIPHFMFIYPHIVIFYIICCDMPPKCQTLTFYGQFPWLNTCPLLRARKQTGPHLMFAHLPSLHLPDQIPQRTFTLKWRSTQGILSSFRDILLTGLIEMRKHQSIFSSYCDILLIGFPNEIVQKLWAHGCKNNKKHSSSSKQQQQQHKTCSEVNTQSIH